jgi:hypothetical protein
MEQRSAICAQTKRPHNFLYSQEGGEREEEEEKGEEEFE